MNRIELADQYGLRRVGARPGVWSYLKQTWERRDFISTMAMYRMSVENQQNRLGAFWLILRPALNALIYGMIFGVLQGNNRPAEYTAYVVIGVFMFSFFSGCFGQGAKAITGNRGLVQSLSFPRLSLPLATVVEEFLSLLLSMVAMFAILIFAGHYPTWKWLLLIPLLLLYSMFNTGIALITARLTVHFRDLTQILPVISRLLFYTSGVLFDVSKIFKSHPWVIQLYDWHPVYQVLVIARYSLMSDSATEVNLTYNPMFWAYLSGWAVVALVVGFLFFWSAEERYGRE